MSFQRRKEDFTCGTCGIAVRGSGYTNHCPKCLWSKHVDVHPGDRSETCGGMMEPVRVEGSSPHYRIVHRCEKCRTERIVDISSGDDMSAIISLAAKREH